MRRKLIAGAAVLALLMNSPNVSADEDVVVFGGEFEDEKPAPKVERPAPIREIPKPVNKPVDEPKPEPINKPTPEPVTKPEPQPVDEPQIEPEPELVTEPFSKPEEVADEDDLGDILIFDEIAQPTFEPVNEPVNEPTPVTEPRNEPTPVNEPESVNEPVIEPQSVDKPEIIYEPEPVEQPKPRRTRIPRQSTPPQNLKTLNQRFIKLAVDETYTYYLDKTSVQWKKMPYSTSEYMADFWIRMIEREPQSDDADFYGTNADSVEILSARERGYRYMPEDEAILRQQSYVLEHYYLRPKTKQIQFLCELEVFGRPQNTINERAYDYRNWEDLVPGSIEAAIYYSVVKVIHMSRANPNNHMTFWDMLDEYARISL